MVKYYTGRVLSEKLNINLAKWKRWSREFLPPDPLGGKQSGYARQYSFHDGLAVYLGGYLVGNLNLSIPETKQILTRLFDWITDHGISSDPNNGNNGSFHAGNDKNQQIKLSVQMAAHAKPSYFIYRVIRQRPLEKNETAPANGKEWEGDVVMEEIYTRSQITMDGSADNEIATAPFIISEKVLHISSVIKEFLYKLESI